jgi:hypothetical protein
MLHVRTGGVLGVLIVIGACTASPPDKGGQVEEKKVEAPAKVEAPVKAETKEEPAPTTAIHHEGEVPVEPQEPGRPQGFAAEQFMFVFRGDVAVESAAQDGWGTGKVRFKETKDGLEGRRDVDATKLPEGLRKLEGAAISLYGARGKVCEAIIKGMTLYGLSERGDEDASAHPNDLPSMPALMAVLADEKGSCAGALWARRSDLPAPVVFTAGKPDRALAAKARAATEALAAYKAMAAEYAAVEKDLPKADKWAKFVTKQFRTVVWTEAGGRAVVVTELGDPAWVACEAYFTESLAAVFEVVGDELKLVSETGPWQAQALFDANGDGAVEALVGAPGGLGGILAATKRGRVDEAIDELRFPSEGLGCAGEDGGDEFSDEP